MTDSPPSAQAPPKPNCYVHTDRPAGILCQRCSRPICPACMHQASVGFQCSSCTKSGAQKVVKGLAPERPTATLTLIAINVVMFVLMELSLRVEPLGALSRAIYSGGRFDGGLYAMGALFGAGVPGEPWRLLTGGFLHDPSMPQGLLHIGMNMFVLWRLGPLTEQVLGRVRFIAVYFAGLFGGALGAVILSPEALTIGASGAVFGLFGALLVISQLRGMAQLRSSMIQIVGFNLLFTFAVPGVSLGGHVGGLIGGAVSAYAMHRVGRVVRGNSVTAEAFASAGLAVGFAIVAYGLMVAQFGFVTNWFFS